MTLSLPRLHPPVVKARDARLAFAQRIEAIALSRAAQGAAGLLPAGAATVAVPLTTVSVNSNFDAYLQIGFKGSVTSATTSLLVDSGNSTLIVPRWEDIAALPGANTNYTVLGQATEPWGCPANIVRGPISLPTDSDGLYELPDCIFYACTGSSNGSDRTANFGAACISPWSASGWNVPNGVGVTLQAPLSYGTYLPYAEIDYAPASQIQAAAVGTTVAGGSYLRLYADAPSGYQMFSIVPSLEWMALRAIGLIIEGSKTQWPGQASNPIAVIDTGGGPVFLSDPDEIVCTQTWPQPVANPSWTENSDTCESVRDAVGVVIGDGAGEFAYVIDPTRLPPAAQGLTLVMCRSNYYMRGEQGMNIGGISALFNLILIDYVHSRVGFKPK